MKGDEVTILAHGKFMYEAHGWCTIWLHNSALIEVNSSMVARRRKEE